MDLRAHSGCRISVNNLAAIAAALALLGILAIARADDPPRLAPAPDAPAHTVHAWTSEGGLRYAWVVPPGLTPEAPRDLVVLCHGGGLDYRWGFANHAPGVFRPGDIVVSVDGTSAGLEGTRLFLGQEEDAEAFAAFLDEMRRVFPVRRVYLYGHSQGGFFVVFFAGVHPAKVDGAVAHASGAWTWSALRGGVLDVPIVFMHGGADPVVPYLQSPGARDAYAGAGHEMVQLRRLPGYNHWPNAVRASECLDWCAGMRTDAPREALERALAILRPKPADEYEYTCPVWFSGAHDLVTRIIGRHPRSFFPVAPDLDAVRAEARPVLESIEAEAARHVERLRAHVRTREDLRLDGGPWLGHLASAREDFRGAAPMEQYAAALDYDATLARHREASVELSQMWYRRGRPKGIFETIVRVLPHCFLVEGLPPGLEEQVPAWFREAAALDLSPESIRSYRHYLMWEAGWRGGLEQYRQMWSAWPGP